MLLPYGLFTAKLVHESTNLPRSLRGALLSMPARQEDKYVSAALSVTCLWSHSDPATIASCNQSFHYSPLSVAVLADRTTPTARRTRSVTTTTCSSRTVSTDTGAGAWFCLRQKPSPFFRRRTGSSFRKYCKYTLVAMAALPIDCKVLAKPATDTAQKDSGLHDSWGPAARFQRSFHAIKKRDHDDD